jgi:hypothetical protein
MTKIETHHGILVKTINTGNKERIVKAVREKSEITYKGKRIKK